MWFKSKDEKLIAFWNERDDFRQRVEKLISAHQFEKAAGEMLPPWIMCTCPKSLPSDPDSSLRAYWTRGEGGYWWRRFLDYWVPLDLEKKKAYFKKYDLGTEWEERHDWASDLFDTGYAIDDMDEAEYEDLFNELLPPTDDELQDTLAEFVGAFEVVFCYDWPYSKTMLGDEDEGATFIEPGLEDETDSWGARGALLERYWRLVSTMKARGIEPSFPFPLDRLPDFKKRVW